MAVLFDPARYFSVIGLSSELLVGAQLSWFVAGTSTAINTYSDIGLTTPNSNPVISDANGRFPQIYLADGTSYKWRLKDSSGVSIMSQDNYATPAGFPAYDPDLADFLAGDEPLPIENGGTASTSAVDALAALEGMGTAGGAFTGQITRSGNGGYIYNSNSSMAEGEVILQALGGPAPTAVAGLWLAEY